MAEEGAETTETEEDHQEDQGPARTPPPVQQPREIKLMGQLPAVFAGDRTLAESFIDSLKAYF